MNRHCRTRQDLVALLALVTALLCSGSPVIAAGDTVTYSYDALGRLTQVTNANGVTVIYALDGAGNRTKVTTIQPPSAPGTPVISSIAGSTATAAWTASSGSPTGYEYSLNGGASWVSVGTALTADLSGLAANGAQYAFSVRAYDAEGGRGPESSATFRTAPSAPGAVTITNLGGTTATSSWGAATDSGGVSGYEYSLNGGASWTNVGNTLTANLTGLTSAAHYTFSVRAYDAAGTRGGASSATFITLDTIPPSTPGAPTFFNVAATSATASWGAATDNVGVTGYEYSLNGGSSWANVGNTLTVNLTGLTEDTTYTLSVRAYDAAGNLGTPSSGSFTTQQVVPSIPTGLAATAASNTQINLSWSPSNDAGGPGIAGYRVYRNGSEIGTTASTSFSDTGVSVFNTYSYTVAAYDTKGVSSANSAVVSGSTYYTITGGSGSNTGSVLPSASSLYQVTVTTTAPHGGNTLFDWKVVELVGSKVLAANSKGIYSPGCLSGDAVLSVASGYQLSGCILIAAPSVYGH